MKVKKIQEIKDMFSDLTKKYEIAKENNDTQELENIKIEYKNLKKLLYSNEAYFGNLKESDLEERSNNATTKEERNKVATLSAQKQQYKSNKSYINMVEKCGTLEDYIKKSKRTNFRFVKRTFKKVVLVGAAAGVLMFSLATCGKNKEKNEKNVDKNITTEETDNTNENTTETTQKTEETETTEEKDNNDSLETAKNSIYLNPISKEKNEKDVKNNDSKSNDDISLENGSETSYISYNDFTPTEKVESLDPNISNYNTNEVINVEIVNETSATEANAIDYKPTTEENKEEKVIIENKSEKTKVEVVEEKTTEEPEAVDYKPTTEETTSKEEKVTIIEKEEETKVEVVEEKTTEEPKTVDYKPTTEENKEEKITVIEKEEETKVEVIEEEKEEEAVDYKPATEEKQEEKITVIETEEPININEDIPVEDGVKTLTYTK